jgi:hypothetical protein
LDSKSFACGSDMELFFTSRHGSFVPVPEGHPPVYWLEAVPWIKGKAAHPCILTTKTSCRWDRAGAVTPGPWIKGKAAHAWFLKSCQTRDCSERRARQFVHAAEFCGPGGGRSLPTAVVDSLSAELSCQSMLTILISCPG